MPALRWVSSYETFKINPNTLSSMLASAPLEDFQQFSRFILVSLPSPDGTLMRYKLAESPIQSPELQAKSPVRTYKVMGVDDRYASGRLDWGPNGFHGYLQTSRGDIVLDPPKIGDRTSVVAYYRKDNYQPRDGWSCHVVETPNVQKAFNSLRNGGSLAAQNNTTLKTYRLAMNATGEYTAFYGGTAVGGQNGVITSINRVNQVYEADLSIRMTIVYNMCYTNGGTDPFSNNSGGTMLGQNQTACDTNVGNANYDIGHVFSTGGGGIAGLGVVGITGQKARGVTGSPSPVGDGYDIDYVAHEMGHQYDGNHTFAGTAGSCSGNGNPSTAYEPGSGSTIQAYAGICGAQDLQPHSDAYFHLISLIEMDAWRDNAASGGTAVGNGNTPPTANAGLDYTIPTNTPFKLTATGSDANGDPLKYCWEIWETGSTGATHRSFTPVTNPTRFVPAFNLVQSNTTNQWDPYIASARTARWRVTVRDNRAGGGAYAFDEMTLNVTGAQFTITAPNTAVSWAGGSNQTVTWTVGGGSVAPNVRILLSTDGGNSYANGTATVLVASTPNDGSQSVTLPNVSTSQARIIVEPIGNIFYDISNVNFTITPTTTPTITSLSPTNVFANQGNFTLTVNGTNFVNGSSVIRWNGVAQTTTFVNSTQLTANIANATNQTIGLIPITVANGANVSNSVNLQVRGIVNPSSYALITGLPVAGGLAELQTSDDLRLRVRPDFSGARVDPNIVVESTFPAPVSSPAELQFKAELLATAGPNDLKLQAFDYVSNAWVDLQTTTTSTTDTTYTQAVTTNTNRYISGGQMKMRVWIRAQSGNGSRTWEGQVDRMFIQIHP